MSKDKKQEAWEEGWPVTRKEGPGRGWHGPPEGTHGKGSQGGDVSPRSGEMGGGNFFEAFPSPGKRVYIDPWSDEDEGGISSKLSDAQAAYIGGRMRLEVGPLMEQYNKMKADPQADAKARMVLFNKIESLANDIGVAAGKERG